ncbi:hypothetical protein NEHOM01_1171 [Nematocida homosporus]|uniref:uncharacterized protein n=1 Tax=Nematocida homosporus TaxID=1912981 RepID=UPI00221E515C|nr:uncharacterized protein NEHOM01_1171 [Nematocida homosporus]KAI5185948.1 hypothetical protein NEHOM01_1171 [Nematocida homosporus]
MKHCLEPSITHQNRTPFMKTRWVLCALAVGVLGLGQAKAYQDDAKIFVTTISPYHSSDPKVFVSPKTGKLETSTKFPIQMPQSSIIDLEEMAFVVTMRTAKSSNSEQGDEQVYILESYGGQTLSADIKANRIFMAPKKSGAPQRWHLTFISSKNAVQMRPIARHSHHMCASMLKLALSNNALGLADPSDTKLVLEPCNDEDSRQLFRFVDITKPKTENPHGTIGANSAGPNGAAGGIGTLKEVMKVVLDILQHIDEGVLNLQGSSRPYPNAGGPNNIIGGGVGIPGGITSGMPGSFPGGMPGSMPGSFPGSMPGGITSSMPGSFPGSMPGGGAGLSGNVSNGMNGGGGWSGGMSGGMPCGGSSCGVPPVGSVPVGSAPGGFGGPGYLPAPNFSSSSMSSSNPVLPYSYRARSNNRPPMSSGLPYSSPSSMPYTSPMPPNGPPPSQYGPGPMPPNPNSMPPQFGSSMPPNPTGMPSQYGPGPMPPSPNSMPPQFGPSMPPGAPPMNYPNAPPGPSSMPPQFNSGPSPTANGMPIANYPNTSSGPSNMPPQFHSGPPPNSSGMPPRTYSGTSFPSHLVSPIRTMARSTSKE